MIKGQILAGKFGDILVREKKGAKLEIGELLIVQGEPNTLVQVTDLMYSSQISQQNLERISGYELDMDEKIELYELNHRAYKLAKVKALLDIGSENKQTKTIPETFALLREIKSDDLKFLSKPHNLTIGKLRSGSKVLDLDISLDTKKILSHHILISGTTGKGKSELMKNLIYNVSLSKQGSMIVFDPHDEYFGRNNLGLKGHCIYYTNKQVPSGQRSLTINIKMLRPDHFDFLDLSIPQKQAMYLFYKKYGKEWIKHIISGSEIKDVQEISLAVLKRQLKVLLDISYDNSLICRGIFSEVSGLNTVKDIINELEKTQIIIIDSSNFSGNTELLVASLITGEILKKYKHYNSIGELYHKPVINVVLEEAPRVIGKDVLARGPNVFGTIAREGRKFKIGITALTQLPSLIPKEVLANMNTKIILGTEMSSERTALIESASHDISSDSKNIAGLNLGEAIVSSSFSPIAIPLKISKFEPQKTKVKKTVMGL